MNDQSHRSCCAAHAEGAAGHQHHHAPAASALTVKDPVCGMNVDPHQTPHRHELRGQTYYFCSAGCRTKFAADPDRYLGDKVPAPARPDAIYTCPMHPEVRQVGPGSCPICGMALEPLDVTAEAGPNPELADMTRRFWIGLVLTLPVLALEMGGHLTNLHMLLGQQTGNWLQLLLGTPVVLWAGWPFFERGWASVIKPQPQHVHADRARHRRRVDLQRGRHGRPRPLPGWPARPGWRGRGLLRSGRGHHGPGASWARCSSCARASRPAAPSRRSSTWLPRPRAGCVRMAATRK